MHWASDMGCAHSVRGAQLGDGQSRWMTCSPWLRDWQQSGGLWADQWVRVWMGCMKGEREYDLVLLYPCVDGMLLF
jgi:hypothetical protein